MKKGWDLYASQKRIKQKGYLRKHRNGSSLRETSETSCRDCIQQSRKIEEEIIYTGEDASERNNRNESERPRRNEEVVRSLMDVQDIPKKQIKRKRKTTNHQ